METSPVKRYYIETWGCQMNVHDSERLAGLLESRGYTRVRSEEEADLVLLNTCAVREKAVHKVLSRLGSLRRLKQLNPALVVGVAGCVAQQEQELLMTESPVVDLVVGPRAVHKLPALLDAVVEGRRAIDVSMTDPRFDELAPATVRTGGPRAYVTIMEGCNKNCSFCIVPFTRGREVYRPVGQVLEEARSLVASGMLELELLGQNVNAWQDGDLGFAGLLRQVDRIAGLRRLRFTTSHPRHFSDDIIEAMADGATLCPELHLPVQSGSDTMLRRMYRGHTREQYVARVERLRQRVPGVALSTDIIVGFPGESDTDFAQTLSLLEEVGFDQVYAFVYSPRPHTRSLALEDPTPEAVKNERLQLLLEAQRERQLRRNQALVGKALEVLCEGVSKSRPGRYTGRTPCRRMVNFTAPEDPTGRMVSVSIEWAGPYSLVGRVTASMAA